MVPKIANIMRASPDELMWLRDHKCKAHHHRYLSHFGCFMKEENIEEKIAFLDIESSNLRPAFGIVFCWCIANNQNNNIAFDCVTKKDLFSPDEDKRIIKSCIEELKKYDRVVGHYSSKFDVPFIRTKAITHDPKNAMGFPKYRELYSTDLWRVAKEKLLLHSNRQNVFAEMVSGQSQKTRINHKYWREGLQGNEKALKYILQHCKIDVIELKKNFNAVCNLINLPKTSI